ncbi:TIGR04372 family glycosyltransferase [Cylindrospermopsis raciborskii]|uniref:TIGR04372 family glycosyltransferase n=1 Tax=Cylindrospermopsis raciborskii TaxID=77022 RepID=UPI001FD5D5FA|nr:TIGR04372 family glycosyltransferase [Cylindrospermopsis raciborskii]
MEKEFVNVHLPHKKPKGKELTQQQKEENRELSRQRVVCEHTHSGIKRYNCVHIETYFKAIQSITDLGGYVIRMGHPGMTPLPTIERVVDYANSKYKSDWMDVFLWASCRFFIGTSSGPLTVPPTFGRPILYTNCPAIGINPYFPRSLMLPRLYYSNTENRFFSFREMLDSSMGWTVSSVFEEIDCTIVDNTPDEIDAAVIEMLEADGLPDTHELSELQTQFNALRSQYGDTGQITISQSFVQKHSSLL